MKTILAKAVVGLPVMLLGLLAGLQSAFSQPGRWERINAQTLRFVGQIDEKTAAQFREIITPKITTIVVKSGGGEVENALQVGQEIHRRQLNIVVDGACGSSCANYWFVAAVHKTVGRGSWVGFHGNPSSSLPYYDVSKFDQAFLDSIAEFEQQEQRFFKQLGVDIELVQRSSTITVAFERPMYLPSPQQLRCFGVSNLRMWYPESVSQKALLWGKGEVVLTQEVESRSKLAPLLCQKRDDSEPSAS